jgi:hypothetical protein
MFNKKRGQAISHARWWVARRSPLHPPNDKIQYRGLARERQRIKRIFTKGKRVTFAAAF